MRITIKDHYDRIILIGVIHNIKNMVIADGKITIYGATYEYMEQQANATKRPAYVIKITGNVELLEYDKCNETIINADLVREKTEIGGINIVGNVDVKVYKMGSIQYGNRARVHIPKNH